MGTVFAQVCFPPVPQTRKQLGPFPSLGCIPSTSAPTLFSGQLIEPSEVAHLGLQLTGQGKEIILLGVGGTSIGWIHPEDYMPRFGWVDG